MNNNKPFRKENIMHIVKFLIIVCLSVFLTACGANSPKGNGEGNSQQANIEQKAGITPKTPQSQTAIAVKTPGKVEISFDFNRRSKIASDQLAVWIEDEQGRHVRTLLVTKFTASGGYHQRTEAVPDWQNVFRPEQASSAAIDSFTSATPKSGRISVNWDCLDQSGKAVIAGRYIYKVEANIEWQKVDLWQGDIAVGPSPSQSVAQSLKGNSSILKAAQADFVPAP